MIDILVNNAGMECVKRLEDIQLLDYQELYNLNVRAPILLTQEVLRYFPPEGE